MIACDCTLVDLAHHLVVHTIPPVVLLHKGVVVATHLVNVSSLQLYVVNHPVQLIKPSSRLPQLAHLQTTAEFYHHLVLLVDFIGQAPFEPPQRNDENFWQRCEREPL